jgi:hypothetical protein
VNVHDPVVEPRRPSRSRLLLGGLLVLFGCAVLVAWLSLDRSRLRAQNLSAVRAGMTRQQVEDLLGGPPGDFGSFPDGLIDAGDGSIQQLFAEPTTRPVTPASWTDDRHSITVFFDDEGRVVAAAKASAFRRLPRGGVVEWLLRRSGAAPPPSIPPPRQ